METIVQLLAFILPIIAFLSVVLVFTVNLYLRIRKQFLVRVNCWFCNQWTKVHYDEQNCFECPTCLQYNGFTSDGDYNKPIPAQQDELLNQQIPKIGNSSSNSNGLCLLCNNNQKLKIYQLANFIPLNEANYDVEIEHFQKQLEKAYKLCPPCESVLKTTLHKQSCFFGLKLTQLRKKGLLLLDLNNSHNGISKEIKRSVLKNLIHYTLIGFAILNLIFVLTRIDFSDHNLINSTPKFMTTHVLKFKNVSLMGLTAGHNMCKEIWINSGFNLLFDNISAIGNNFIITLLEAPFFGQTFSHVNTTLETVANLSKTYWILELPKVENTVSLCFVGGLFQGILLLLNDKTSFRIKLFRFAMWIILGCVHWKYPSRKHFNIYLNTIQVLTSTVIITSMIFRKSHKRLKQRKLKRISKGVSNRESSQLGELSDNEESHSSTAHNSTFKIDRSFNAKTAIPKCSPHSKSIFGQPAILEDHLNNQKPFYDIRSTGFAKQSLNQSFTSAKTNVSDQSSLPDTASVFNSSFLNHNSSDDIDISLNKLNLGTTVIKQTSAANAFFINNDVTRPRPVISPAKLKNVTQNSWVAGGFWRDSNGILMPLNTCPNLSRSSSQTSGFASQTGPPEPNNFNSLPSSVNNSFYGDVDCGSVLSEPAYYMNGSYVMHGRNLSSRFVGHNNLHRTFYPVVNHEQLVYFAPYPFANKSPNTFSHSLDQSNFSMSGAVNPNTNKTYKPGGLLKDWINS